MPRLTLKTIALFAALFLAAAHPAAAQTKEASVLGKAEIENIVRDFIMENPDVILTSVDAYQRKSSEERQNAAIESNKKDLYADDASPFIGNAKGDVTVVEFFDYNCGYCKRVLPMMEELVKTDKNLKIIFKEFPILSPASETAAKWALAAHTQGKYFEFHSKLMQHRGQIGEDTLVRIATELKLDATRLKKDSEGTDPLLQIERNRALAAQLGVTGTPAFVVGREIAPGAIPVETMKEMIARARAEKK